MSGSPGTPPGPPAESTHAGGAAGPRLQLSPAIRFGISYRGSPGSGSVDGSVDRPPAWVGDVRRRMELIELRSTFDRLLAPSAVEAWASGTPDGLTIDVQAFRPLTRHRVRRAEIPAALHPELRRRGDFVRPTDLLGMGRYELWEGFRRSVEPLRRSGKLGAVILRFPGGFAPDLAGQAFLAILRERLPQDRLIVELPGSWFTGPASATTGALLRDFQLGVAVGLGPSATVTPDVLPEGTPIAALRIPASQVMAPGVAALVLAAARHTGGDRAAPGVHVLISGDRAAASRVLRDLRSGVEAISGRG